MPDFISSRRSRSGLLASVALGVLALFPIAYGPLTPAQAQVTVSISVDFRAALEPYGAWHRHPRWGEVWVPAGRARDWRPYQVGHWVYTEEWGWYWISDEDEADWGWVAYHYCRWIVDPDYGWACVPGGEWAPAWVDWRYGNDYVGWSPLPPDEIIVETRDDPQFWVFVRQRDLTAPRAPGVFLPVQQRTAYLRRTVVVNRTVVIDNRDHRFAVNPGIPPAYIAKAQRRPLATFQVRPRVFVGTRGIEGGVEIRAEEFRSRRGADPRVPARARTPDVAVQRTTIVIQPAASVPRPQALGSEEKGRLGTTPPRAAQRAVQAPAPQPPATPTSPPQAPQAVPPTGPTRPAAPSPQATPPAITPLPSPQATPRPETLRPAAPAPQATPPAATPPPTPQATPRAEPPRPIAPAPQTAPRVEPPRPAAPAPQATPPAVTPPPAPQATPRVDPPRPAAPTPQTAPRVDPPRPVAPPPQAAPPKPPAPAQQEKKKGSE